MIWRFAAPQPGFFIVAGPSVLPNETERDITLPALRKLPALLMVSAEARYEALKVFRPLFLHQIGNQLYFDQENDTLYIKRRAMRLLFTRTSGFGRRASCERIKYVALSSMPICPIHGRPFFLYAYILWQLPYIEEATIILGDIEAISLTALDRANMVMDTYMCLDRYYSIRVAGYPDRKLPEIYAYTVDELEERIAAGRPKR
jgi:hypothetical protein